MEPLFVVSTSDDSCFSVCVRFREASASARVSNCGLSPAAAEAAAAVVVVLDAVDALASHEQGAGTAVNGAAGSTGAGAATGVGVAGDASSVVSIELSSLSSDTLRTRVIGYASTPGISLGVPMMLPAEHAVAAEAVACGGGGSGATVDAFRAAVAPVLATVDAAVCSLFDEPDDDTVDSCSWINIMWSPSLIVRFNGALPDRKSLTCEPICVSTITIETDGQLTHA